MAFRGSGLPAGAATRKIKSLNPAHNQMMNSELLDSIVSRVMKALPGGEGQLARDLEKNLRAAMLGVFNRMDLVTREEFELQSELLSRTRTKLELLERQMAELEARLKEKHD